MHCFYQMHKETESYALRLSFESKTNENISQDTLTQDFVSGIIEQY